MRRRGRSRPSRESRSPVARSGSDPTRANVMIRRRVRGIVRPGGILASSL
jgi:hypothetical protein